MTLVNPEENEVAKFLDSIFADEEGFVYVAQMVPSNHSQFAQNFFEWPVQRDEIASFIMQRSDTYEMYVAPALFAEKSAKKEAVKGARVYWVEFDGNEPDSIGDLPWPSIRVCSSNPGHAHWYWRSAGLVPPHELERVNRALTYQLGADTSGWDANQILRPVGTRNHKRGANVTLAERTDSVLPASGFGDLPEPPAQVETPLPESIPEPLLVISRYSFASHIFTLFQKGPVEGKDRSAAIMSLGYYLAEMGLSVEEMLSMLHNADDRWGKFKDRSDRMKRLMEIITKAKAKYPAKFSIKLVEAEIPDHMGMGWDDFCQLDIQLEWVWEGLLQEAGYFLLTGAPGVGKSTFTLDAMIKLALGQDCLERPVAKPRRIGIVSLEMGPADLKWFMTTQQQGFTKEERQVLNENLRIFALGEPLYLTQEEPQKLLENWIKQYELDGLVIDSMGSTTPGSLSGDEHVKTLMDWNDHLRQETGIFTWYIHHQRKANGDNKKPNQLADVFGSQYITARATTVVCLWDSGIVNNLQFLPLKVRLVSKPDAFDIYRDTNLHFTLKKAGITLLQAESKEEEEKTTPTESHVTPGGMGL